MRTARTIVTLIGLVSGCLAERPPCGSEKGQPAHATSGPRECCETAPISLCAALVSTLPDGWHVSPATEEQKALYFEGPDVTRFALVGRNDVVTYWTDWNGQQHEEAFGKECIFIWSVPGNDVTDALWLLDLQGRPHYPVRVYASRALKVYAKPWQYSGDEDRARLNALLPAVTRIWTSEIELSWQTWAQDIRQAAAKFDSFYGDN